MDVIEALQNNNTKWIYEYGISFESELPIYSPINMEYGRSIDGFSTLKNQGCFVMTTDRHLIMSAFEEENTARAKLCVKKVISFLEDLKL